MPTYLYECKSCDKTFEVEQRITEAPLRDCGCGAEGQVRRLIQPTAILFKGAGFHVNDYASQTAAPAKAESSGEACSGTPTSCGRCGTEGA